MAPRSRNSPPKQLFTTAGTLELTSGIQKYPSERDDLLKSPTTWIKGRRKDEDVYPFWRVHDKLYDLTPFLDKHPGGKFWLEVTRGTDITEAFETSHFGSAPEKLLGSFFVKGISRPRVSPFTFQDGGFYKTLKRKVTPILREVGTGPDKRMILIQDTLIAGFLLSGVVASVTSSYLWAVMAGVLLALVGICAHNFFHQRDNWRMKAFDLTLLSSREWRVSHALSHHIYPNTVLDYEVAGFEPHLELLAKEDKGGKEEVINVVIATVLSFVLAFYFEGVKRGVAVARGETQLRTENLFPLVQLVGLVAVNGLYEGMLLWATCHTVSSVLFVFVGTTAAHHHPNIYREGDTAPSDKDWGIHQIIATRERGEMFTDSLLLASVSFGNHTLHHLFPTVDHSKLRFLKDSFLETCREFGIKFEVYSPLKHVEGLFRTFRSTHPNRREPDVLLRD